MEKVIPVPDTADWTWVLGQHCPQCGVDVRTFTVADLIHRSHQYVGRFREALENTPDPGQRPDPETWSLLEYGAHLRDVCEVFRSRIRAMLLRENPSYPDWDQNTAAEQGRYSELDPLEVADELKTAAGDLLRDVMHLSTEEFRRTGERSDGYVFTVASLLHYHFHELVHHWWDVSGERFPTDTP